MILFIIGAKKKENPSMQTEDIIDFVRLRRFPPAQPESYPVVKLV